jgi:RHS repeat-associated protein
MQITRDAHNGLVTATELGRVADSYAYNAFGELTNYCVTVDGSNLYHAALERDRLGRITRRVSTDSNGTRTNVYTYDVAGRYIEAITNGVTMRWAFDLNGNLTNVSRGGTAIASARYDAEDRLEQWNTDTYGYTARGTLSTAVLDGVVHCYDYDVRGVLRGVTRDAGAVTGITYTADGMGRRMARFVNGTQTHAFLYYDDIHPAAVLNSSNGIEAVLAYPPNGGTPVYMTVTGRTFRIVTDHLGSPLFVVDSVTGEITQRMTYNTWGAVQSDSQPLLQPIGFGGGLYDPETGWVRFGARDYDPAVGRWTTKDPNLFADRIPNLYRYCRNDPVNMVDSRGAVPTPRIKDPSQHYEPDPRGPHGIKGPSVTGEATILVNRRPAARVSDTGIHTPLAGPELWKAAGGAENVLIEIMYPMEIETERAASAIAAEAAVSGYTVGFVGDNQPVCIPHEGTPVSP